MMNAMGSIPGSDPERGEEPDIILVALEKTNYFMYKGDEHLNQLLLMDGEYPKPVLCVHFETLFEAKRIVGEDFSLMACWAIHPAIIERLRNEDCLIETDA
jgi:hypothetical protein